MKIVVLCGGVSPEREVSLDSGAAVTAALCEFGYDAVSYDVKSISDFIKDWPSLDAEGVFIALHGGWGEDGRIQAVLEAFEIPYTGSGPEACMFSMDKTAAKLAFKNAGIPVPDGFLATREEPNIALAEDFLRKYGRIIVKPNGGGSTVGVTQVADMEDYCAALELSWQSEPKALVEQFIEGEELTVPVFQELHGAAAALPPIHIKPITGFYDYKNKYTHGNTEYICPADFPEETMREICRYGAMAHNALGCSSYSRTDLRLAPDGGLYVLETNIAPGMTSNSLVPKAAKAAGMGFGEFLDKVIKVSFGK